MVYGSLMRPRVVEGLWQAVCCPYTPRPPSSISASFYDRRLLLVMNCCPSPYLTPALHDWFEFIPILYFLYTRVPSKPCTDRAVRWKGATGLDNFPRITEHVWPLSAFTPAYVFSQEKKTGEQREVYLTVTWFLPASASCPASLLRFSETIDVF